MLRCWRFRCEPPLRRRRWHPTARRPTGCGSGSLSALSCQAARTVLAQGRIRIWGMQQMYFQAKSVLRLRLGAMLAAIPLLFSSPVANASPYDTVGFFNCLNANFPMGWPPNSDDNLILAGSHAAKMVRNDPSYGGFTPDERFELAVRQAKRYGFSKQQAYWIAVCGIKHWPMLPGY
jgi:hypothetical protein